MTGCYGGGGHLVSLENFSEGICCRDFGKYGVWPDRHESVRDYDVRGEFFSFGKGHAKADASVKIGLRTVIKYVVD